MSKLQFWTIIAGERNRWRTAMKKLRVISVVIVLSVSILFAGCDFINELLGIEPDATQIGVTISENSVASGGNFTIVVTALDSKGALVSSFSGTVTLSASEGTISPATVSLQAGSATATPAISGIDVETDITVTASFGGISSGIDTILVSPPTASSLSLEIDQTAITSGDSCEITVAAEDTDGTTVTTFTGTVQLTSSVGSLTPNTIQITTGGTATGSFVFSGVTTTGVATVTASFTGMASGMDTITVNGVPIVATQIILEVTDEPKEVDNGAAVSLRVTAADEYGNPETGLMGTVDLAVSGTAVLSSYTVNITAEGTAVASPTITINGLTEDEPVILTASYGSLISGTDAVTVKFVPQGESLYNTDFETSGWGSAVLSGTYHVAARDPSSSEIDVAGDIVINQGVKLVVYPGVTFEMGDSSILVYGELEIIGTDEARVRLRSNSSNWGGIAIGGDSAGSATAMINGAYIDGLANSAIYCGALPDIASGQVSVTNSRIHIDTANREAIRLRIVKSGTVNTFSNNIILFTGSNWYAFDGYSSLSGSFTFDIVYNTIIGKGSGSAAVNTSDSNATNVYNLTRNLIAGGYSYAIQFSSAAPQHYLTNNLMKTATNWDGVSGGGTYDGTLENLYESTGADNFLATWNNEGVFANYTAGDFHLAQPPIFPTLEQASDIASMAGCLTAGDENEVGAYGNGGYPPNYDE
jgi:hypothetical protein